MQSDTKNLIFIFVIIYIIITLEIMWVKNECNQYLRYIHYFVCLPIRVLLVYNLYVIAPKYLQYTALITLPISLGFLNQYIKGKRGIEGGEILYGAFGGKLWWNDLRLLNAITHGLHSAFALTEQNVSILLMANILIGYIYSILL